MPRPIPVFEFVITAYAATCAGRVFRSAATPPADVGASILRQVGVYSAPLASTADLSTEMKGLLAKVSVGDGGSTGEPLALTPGLQPGVPCEELWLSGIVETPSGFLGVVHFRPERLTHVRVGDAIAFRRGQVLEWKHFEPQALAAPAACEAALP